MIHVTITRIVEWLLSVLPIHIMCIINDCMASVALLNLLASHTLNYPIITGGVTWRVRLWQVRVDQCVLRCDVQYGPQYSP